MFPSAKYRQWLIEYEDLFGLQRPPRFSVRLPSTSCRTVNGRVEVEGCKMTLNGGERTANVSNVRLRVATRAENGVDSRGEILSA